MYSMLPTLFVASPSDSIKKQIRTDLEMFREDLDMGFAQFSFAAEDGATEGAISQ
jgi:hypothetical protein